MRCGCQLDLCSLEVPQNFQPRSIGPFKVLFKVGEIAYRLSLPPPMQPHPGFYVSLLQAHKPRPAELMQPQSWKPVNKAEFDEDPIYEVEHILDYQDSGK